MASTFETRLGQEVQPTLFDQADLSDAEPDSVRLPETSVVTDQTRIGALPRVLVPFDPNERQIARAQNSGVGGGIAAAYAGELPSPYAANTRSAGIEPIPLRTTRRNYEPRYGDVERDTSQTPDYFYEEARKLTPEEKELGRSGVDAVRDALPQYKKPHHRR